MKQRTYGFMGIVLSFVIQMPTTAQMSTPDIKHKYEYFQNKYDRKNRDPKFLDSLFKTVWFEMRNQEQAKKIAEEYINSLEAYKLIKREQIKFINFLVLASQSKDNGFDFSSLNRKVDALLQEYEKNTRSPILVKNLARLASLLGKKDVSGKISADYINSLNRTNIYEGDNLYFISEFTSKSSDPGFNFFRKNIRKIDRLTEPRLAEKILGKIIYFENIKTVIERPSTEPNWDSLSTVLSKNFGRLGEQRLLQSKIYHYLNKGRNDDNAFNIMFDYMSKYYLYENALQANNMAWMVFENRTDKGELLKALKWSKMATDLEPHSGNWKDTYANLLHKLNRTQEAISMEEVALQLEPNNLEIKSNLEKMKAGIKTWPGMEAVEFDKQLGLAELLQKAKSEGKPIFIDFMATWCGPCKEMDKYVYSNKFVGKLLNENFVSVKIQGDRTSSDSDYVKGWYEDSEKFMRKYEVNAFPTLLFLTADGKLIEKVVGALDSKALISKINELIIK